MRADEHVYFFFHPRLIAEYAEAFDKVDRAGARSGRLTPSQIDDVLRLLYHGPPPAAEAARVAAAFKDVAAISKQDFLTTIERLIRTLRLHCVVVSRRLRDRRVSRLRLQCMFQRCVRRQLRSFFSLHAEEESKEQRENPAAHYNSFRMLHDHYLRNVRPAAGPKEVFSAPLTANQEVGWRADEAKPEARASKRHCEETKFMSALYASGYL